MEDINYFYVFCSCFLFMLVGFIYLIPSGDPCPSCKSHLNDKVVLRSLDKDRIIEFKLCFKCRYQWDKRDNGISVDKFKEEIEKEHKDE